MRSRKFYVEFHMLLPDGLVVIIIMLMFLKLAYIYI